MICLSRDESANEKPKKRRVPHWLERRGQTDTWRPSNSEDYAVSHQDMVVSRLGHSEDVKTPELNVLAQPATIAQPYSPQFYAELWGISVSTVVRWFQDMDEVLRVAAHRQTARGQESN
jgi:hypothetical protein